MPKPKRDRIEKPEDRIWKEWFDKLSKKDHEQYFEKLGLTKDDMEELPEIEAGLNNTDVERDTGAGAQEPPKRPNAKGKR